MRLLLFFWGSGEGGDASATIELARSLAENGQPSTLAAYAFSNPEAFKQKALGAGLEEPILVQDPGEVFGLGRLQRGAFDLIHVHHGTPVPKRTDIVPLRKTAGGLPMVLTVHGPTPLSEITYGGWKSRLSRMISARWFRAVIVPSQAKVAEWRRMTPFSGNVVAIPNVVRFFKEIPRREARADFQIPADAKVALYCSRLDQEKQPMAFVRAIELAVPACPNLVGLMAGSGQMVNECAKYISAKGLPVRLLGYVTDVERLYSAANVFVQCSTYESFGITLLQAAALGLPCVASEIPVFREMYRELDSFAWWDLKCEQGLAEAITAQLEREPDTSGQMVLKDRYSESAVVQAHLALYRKVLGR